jgi:hypothetical protein
MSVRVQPPMALSIDVRVGLTIEDRYLLIAIMRMHGNLGAYRKSSDTSRDVVRAECFGDQRDRLNTIAAINYRQRFDSQNMRVCHGDISFRSLAVASKANIGLADITILPSDTIPS